MIEKISTVCQPRIAGMNMRFFWCRIRLSATPLLVDGGGVDSVGKGGTGIFTITLTEALPDSVIMLNGGERPAGNYGFAMLTGWDTARKTATIEWYRNTSANAPALDNGTTSDFLHLLFLFVGR